jgi:hypothetical protein
METEQKRNDIEAIKAIITRQLASASWASGKSADWNAFAADFLPGATLYPAARPAKCQTVQAFIERMKGLAESQLRSFNAVVLRTEIRVFGNVAVAAAVCEMTENDTQVNRTVEMSLLIRDRGSWQIVSQAWDPESQSNPISVDLLADSGPTISR